MNSGDFRRRAATVRATPLEAVLAACGAVRDRHDRSQWHTEQGPVSVTGAKFMNWHVDRGGGGAIDLVMHLVGVDCRAAVAWLEQHFGTAPATAVCPAADPARKSPPAAPRPRTLELPVPDARMLDRVRRYLAEHRRLSASLLEPLIASDRLYADRRGNAVFLLTAGTAARPVGAELRGTGPRAWRGMAPGTSKDRGYFWIGVPGFRRVVLCESAIDAISCFQMRPDRICISTSGVRANPPWLAGLLARGYAIFCGFDADGPGDATAAAMLALYPAVQRLRPPAKDWNDTLASGQ